MLPVTNYFLHPSLCMNGGCGDPACPILYSWMCQWLLQPGPARPVPNTSTHECWRFPWSCIAQPVTTPSSQENQLKLQVTGMGPHIQHTICPHTQFSHCSLVPCLSQEITITVPILTGGYCDPALPCRLPAQALVCTNKWYRALINPKYPSFDLP